jgi:2-oxoglutarate ferredoxin oxidoreductase subunit beta
LLKGAIQHKGFAFVDVFSPCVTYNKDNTYQFFNPRVKILEEQGHDPADFQKAMEKGYQWGDDGIPIGLFWKRTDLQSLEELEPVLDQGGPLACRQLGITDEQSQALINELL